MTRKNALLASLHDYLRRFPDEASTVERAIDAFGGSLDPFMRGTLPGHITASGIVLSSDGRADLDGTQILLVWHGPTARWLQPGGHVEGNETPIDTALREVREETGYRCRPHDWHRLCSGPIDIDTHTIPANPFKNEPRHWHCDLRFVLVPEGAAGLPSDAHRTAWRPLAAIDVPGLSRIRDKLARADPGAA